MREPFVVATENDGLNGVAMLMGHQLTGTAQVFADVRTYWSPEAIERVTGHKLDGLAEHGIIHLIQLQVLLRWTVPVNNATAR